mgnify:CR=1 FL=1
MRNKLIRILSLTLIAVILTACNNTQNLENPQVNVDITEGEFEETEEIEIIEESVVDEAIENEESEKGIDEVEEAVVEDTEKSIVISFAGDCTLGGYKGQGAGGQFKDYYDQYGHEYFFADVKSVFESDDLKRRFSLIYLGADAIATYDILFQNYKTPKAIVIHDHGFGCNYNSFGGYGALFEIANKTNTFPKFMLRSSNTIGWGEYYKAFISNEFLSKNVNAERDLEILK